MNAVQPETTTAALATVSKEANGSYTLRYERHYNHPIANVWQALTDPAKLPLWFGELRVPFSQGRYELFFTDFNSGATGTVRRFEPVHLLEYTWDHVTVEPTLVRWELSEDGPAATRLTLVHSNLRKNVANYGSGWHIHLEAFAEVVDGDTSVFKKPAGLEESLLPEYEKMVKGQLSA